MTKQEQTIYDLVSQYYFDNRRLLPGEISVEDISHVFNIGMNILLHKWGIATYKPGGFVSAFLDNDLMGTYAKADTVNQRAIYFFVMMSVNVQCPKEILAQKAGQ